MIRCQDIRFSYAGNGFQLEIESLELESGKQVALIGPSGSGKTTLIHLIAGILLPQSGRIEIDDVEVSALSAAERRRFRLERMGQIPQSFELLDYLTVLDNILVPVRLSGNGSPNEDAFERARELAERAGISLLLDRFPDELSQGERQRVALCRGLIHQPLIILADEPTGNLDPENESTVLELMMGEASRLGSTLLMITHEPSLLERFDRVVDVAELRRKEEG